MPITSTPERLLGRNDSKNPSTTCRGITSAGRPCRRALAASMLSRRKKLDDNEGVVAVVHENGRLADAQYYCWQHKDQVQPVNDSPSTERVHAGSKPSTRKTQVVELKNRGSIDSLLQNLNLQSVSEKPRMSMSRDESPAKAKQSERRRQSRRAPPKEPSPWRSLCCMFAAEDDDTIEIVRHKHRVQQGRVNNSVAIPISAARRKPTDGRLSRSDGLASHHGKNPTPDQPLTYISPGTLPQIAASILSELAKPISVHDEEGYIYMFWLTPASHGIPRTETTRSLLSSSPTNDRRLSDVMTEFSVPEDDPRPDKRRRNKIILKIGRANNVTRRMNEWQRQCGYEVSLIRWYPYIRDTATSSPLRPSTAARQPQYPDLSQHGTPLQRRPDGEGIRRVPFVKRVERLIHLELNSQQVKRQCATCGREHREWFKIDANEQGVRQVDKVIRKWVDWSEQQSSMVNA